MMAKLLVWRGRIIHFYEKYYRVVRGGLRALTVLAALLLLSGRFPNGYFVDKQWIFILIAIVCGVLPDVVSITSIVLVVSIEVWNVSPVLACMILFGITVFFLLFGRKAREQWYIMLSIPTFSVMHMGFCVPVVAALFAGPSMLPALIMGILLRFSLDGVIEYTATAQRVVGSESGFLAPMQYLVDYLSHNLTLLVALIVYVLTFAVIYVLRRSNFRYAPQIAILVGNIVLFTLEMISNIVWDLELDLVLTSILVIVTMGIAYLVQFFRTSLDYHGTRRLQFEDDEYYYYVTAIPKYKVADDEKIVTKILPEDSVLEGHEDLKEELAKSVNEEKEQDNKEE